MSPTNCSLSSISKRSNLHHTDEVSQTTAFLNPNRTVYEEMTYWTALKMHLGIKTPF